MFTVRMLGKDGKVDFYNPNWIETRDYEFTFDINGEELSRIFQNLEKVTVHMGSGREEVLFDNGQLLNKTK